MKKVSITEIKANFDNYLKESQGEPIVITEADRPIAAISLIVDPDELERFMLANNAKFNQIIAKSKQSLKEDGGLKSDDFWKLVDELSPKNSEINQDAE